MLSKRWGFRYRDGKVFFWPFYATANPGDVAADEPAYSVDIRELIALGFVGACALAFIIVHEYTNAMILATSLMSYVAGRTVPTKK